LACEFAAGDLQRARRVEPEVTSAPYLGVLRLSETALEPEAIGDDDPLSCFHDVCARLSPRRDVGPPRAEPPGHRIYSRTCTPPAQRGKRCALRSARRPVAHSSTSSSTQTRHSKRAAGGAT